MKALISELLFDHGCLLHRYAEWRQIDHQITQCLCLLIGSNDGLELVLGNAANAQKLLGGLLQNLHRLITELCDNRLGNLRADTFDDAAAQIRQDTSLIRWHDLFASRN